MTDMDGSLLLSLSKHLKSELGLHRQLLGIAEEKRDTIVAGDIQIFSDLLKQEQQMLEEGQQLRHIREALMIGLAREVSVDVDKLRMAQILERAPEELRKELSGLQGSLKELLERLRDVNDRNMVLIRQSLTFVKEIMGYIMGDESTKAYNQQGESPGETGGGKMFDASC